MIGALLSLLLAQTAAPLDLERYLGDWFELARTDVFFERGCEHSRAHYERDGARLRVTNRCTVKGKEKVVHGTAWAPDPAEPGKLKLQFFWPFSADSWVLETAADYSWALVGDPKKSSCWIFSRSASLPAALYAELVSKLAARGYPTGALIRASP